MAKALWKNFERFIADIFCTTRTPLSGGNGKVTRSDTFHNKLFLSMKYTASNNKGLRDLVDEEREKAHAENKIAVCVIGEAGDRANSLVVQNGSVEIDMESSSKRTKPVST